jgi:hypothetical protein
VTLYRDTLLVVVLKSSNHESRYRETQQLVKWASYRLRKIEQFCITDDEFFDGSIIQRVKHL